MQNWKKVLLKKTDVMSKAIDAIDKGNLQIALVVDDDNKLLGTVTDGDIRRALLKKFTMDTDVSEIMFQNPTTASIEDDRATILSLMKKRKLLQVPIVDANSRVVGLEKIHQLIDENKHDNLVLLMAGGCGLRLRPLTNDTPKPLLKVGSKPILENILDQFIESGFHNFYISIHYKAEMVREFFGDGSRWGVDIKYIQEQEPLGTAGSIGLLPSNETEFPIIVMNGDLLTKINFDKLLKYHNSMDGVATMCVREYEFQVPYGVVEAEDNFIKQIIEKPIQTFFVNAGIYVLGAEVCDRVSGNKVIDMTTLLEEAIENNGRINMFPLHEYWLDIGRMEDYENAQRYCS